MPSPADEKLAMTLTKALNKRLSPETLLWVWYQKSCRTLSTYHRVSGGIGFRV